MLSGAQASPASRRTLRSRRAHRGIARLLAAAVLSLLAFGAPPAAAGRLDATGWQQAELGLSQAWQVTHGSPKVVVAVVDTGVQADHPALRGRVLPGYDLVNHDADAGDDNGHGTAVAGIVASTCPVCRILPVKVLGADMTGGWSTIASGVTWAADHGADVINLSIGGPHAPDALAAAISHALAKGVIVVAAAGNDGQNETFYPAMYPGVISVAGIDENRSRYEWSNFGSWVTVAAPGCATTAWLAGGYTPDFCGSSTAAPFVAGVAGLARSLRPALTPGQFARAVGISSEPLPDGTVAASGCVEADRLLLALGAAGAAAGQAPLTTVAVKPRSAQ